ncbi:ferredoxin [Nocardioides sp. KR10-350]|uniref:ferredoxin n=1 Tax=Nocardioides cheoyonin TaxID=3156615 RepID=UPI0032B42D0D
MKVRVDPAQCRGYGICHELAERHFNPDDWGLVQSTGEEVESHEVAAVQNAIASCPYGAIRWVRPNELVTH